MHQQWSRWFADPEKHFYTRAGNRKPPSYSEIVKFVSDAVKELNSDTVKKSFRVCGIAEKGDRIELNELHGRLRTLVECKEEEKAEVLEGNSEDESESDDEIIPIDDGGDELQDQQSGHQSPAQLESLNSKQFKTWHSELQLDAHLTQTSNTYTMKPTYYH